MAIEALLERHAAQEIVDVQGQGLLDQAVERHLPGPECQRLRRPADLLVRVELVKIVVASREALVGQRPIALVALVAGDRIEPNRRVRLDARRRRRLPLGRTVAP
jgi:hypothetical protein